MITFTIDSENCIAAHSGVPATTEGGEAFTTQKELASLAARWPASRLVDIWNSLAGTASFEDLQPVKKFTSRSTALARIWQAVSRLAVEETPSRKAPHKAIRPTGEPSNKKAQVIAMMHQRKGATLAAIMETTGWQKHTVRGFVSILGRKGEFKIESSVNSAGHRSYRITK